MIKLKKIAVVLGAVIVMLLLSTVVLTITSKAEGSKVVKAGDTVIATEDASIMESTSSKAWAAGIAIAVVATGGAVAMGMSITKSVESIARQPEAEGKIRTTLMLGLVFIETAIIYALVVAILIIFVL